MGLYREKSDAVQAELYRPGLEDYYVNGYPVIRRGGEYQFVFPGNYVVTDKNGQRRAMSKEDFEAHYESID